MDILHLCKSIKLVSDSMKKGIACQHSIYLNPIVNKTQLLPLVCNFCDFKGSHLHKIVIWKLLKQRVVIKLLFFVMCDTITKPLFAKNNNLE